MSQHNHYTASACATVSIETYSTEKGAEKELKKKLKIIQAVAKSLDIDLWVDEIIVEE